MHKTEFVSYNFPFFILFMPLVDNDIIEIKPAPGDNESNFKKEIEFRVGAIPSEPL